MFTCININCNTDKRFIDIYASLWHIYIYIHVFINIYLSLLVASLPNLSCLPFCLFPVLIVSFFHFSSFSHRFRTVYTCEEQVNTHQPTMLAQPTTVIAQPTMLAQPTTVIAQPTMLSQPTMLEQPTTTILIATTNNTRNQPAMLA